MSAGKQSSSSKSGPTPAQKHMQNALAGYMIPKVGENWQQYGGDYQASYAPWMDAVTSAFSTIMSQPENLGIPGYASQSIQQMVEGGGNPFDTSGQYNALKKQFGLQRDEDLAGIFEALGGKASSAAGYGAGKYIAQSSADMDKLMADIAMNSYESAQGRKMTGLQYAMQEPTLAMNNLSTAMSGANQYQQTEENAIARKIAEYGRTQYGFLPYLVSAANGPGQSSSKSSGWNVGI